MKKGSAHEQDVCLRMYISNTSRNPTANAICEQMHQTVENILRTILYENKARSKNTQKTL